MGDIKHAPGTFCWTDLATTDPESAKSFYRELLGWGMKDDAIPGGGMYTMISYHGGAVGGMFAQPDDMRARGVPPHWTSYVSVASADETAARAQSLGGTILKSPFDVMDAGRMAVIADPSRAALAVWEPKRSQGADHVGGKTGSMVWNELLTNNVDRCGKFYTDLFGWSPKAENMGGTPYTMFVNGESPAGGMLALNPEWGDVPSHWMVYFAVTDCDTSVTLAKRLGGQVRLPATDIPDVGRFALLLDKQGAAFALIQLEKKS